MSEITLNPNVERRKQVRLKMRADLYITTQRYEGKRCQVVKDPIGLKYYRFNEQEFWVLTMMNGENTLETIQKEFEKKFRPHRLTLEDLESFARQLAVSGLVQPESSPVSKSLYDKRRKQRRLRKLATYSNILYIKLPIFDPDRLLTWMLKYTWWIFTYWFLFLSVAFMFSAAALVAIKFNVFWDKLPAYEEFFRFRTVLYLWISLGFVKVIHEFGHGLSCKAFGGECHEMGALFLCFSPALYCNVTDAWTLADKWKRIIISFAGIYVELIIAAAATFVWWYTPHLPFINNLSLCLMTLCSISTFVFNANPLMRFDGYYILADWLEIPNLRDRANRYLSNLFQEYCLGIEVQPEPYMATGRKILFVTYAVVSYIYRWVITFSILWFLSSWLKPYKLETLSMLLALAALGTMIFWPLFRVVRNIRQRGRLPDMKTHRVIITCTVFSALIAAFLFVPLPVSRVWEKGVVQIQEKHLQRIHLADPGILEVLYVAEGEWVEKDQLIAILTNPDMEAKLAEEIAERDTAIANVKAYEKMLVSLPSDQSNKREDIEGRRIVALGDARRHEAAIRNLESRLQPLQGRSAAERSRRVIEVRAPRAGYIMGLPKKQEIGKYWEKGKEEPFCTVGDTRKLRVAVPVTPPDYRLLKEELDPSRGLEVSIHVPGRSDRVWQGIVWRLPESDEKNIPFQLTDRGGGSLAVQPGNNPNVNVPLAQHYLVHVEILDSDETITPGILVDTQIHCRWRSAGWWCYRKIATALKLGII